MKILFQIRNSLLGFIFLLSPIMADPQNSQGDTAINILSIGNAYYMKGPFDSYEGINYSAKAFSKATSISEQKLVLSAKSRLFTKTYLITVIRRFISGTQKKNAKLNIGIIYYCGHGLADNSGSAYLVPGNIDAGLKDTTFEFLSKKLLNVDDIIEMIIAAQSDQSHPVKFILLADCCSNRVLSKLYKGITYNFLNHSEGSVAYDSIFIKNTAKINSDLAASAALTFDELNKPAKSDPVKPTVNEFGFIPEMIRFRTFMQNGNAVYYSSKMGEVTSLVDDPDPAQIDYEIGPICRRTLLYFGKKGKKSIDGFLTFLSSENDYPVTSPVLIDRTRN